MSQWADEWVNPANGCLEVLPWQGLFETCSFLAKGFQHFPSVVPMYGKEVVT